MDNAHPIFDKYSDIGGGKYKSYIVLLDGRLLDVSRLPGRDGITCHMDGVYYLCLHDPSLLGLSSQEADRLLSMRDTLEQDKSELIEKVLSSCILVGEAGDRHILISCGVGLVERVWGLYKAGRIRLHPSNNQISHTGTGFKKVGISEFANLESLKEKWK